jgi:hypothetical protein
MVPETRRLLRKGFLYPDTSVSPNVIPSSYIYTREMALQDGGILRKLLVSVKYTFNDGLSFSMPNSPQSAKVSEPQYVTAIDPVPEITGDNLSYEVSQNYIILNEIEVSGENTGFVIVRGMDPDFQINQIAETRFAGNLPYKWDGLTADSDYYFRLAPKDGLSDLTGSYLDLLYSPALLIHTLAVPPPDPDPDPDPEPDPEP